MSQPSVSITSLTDLMSALSAREPSALQLQTSIACPHSITLPSGFSLIGADKDRCILSFGNGDGIGLTANNQVADLTVIAPACLSRHLHAGRRRRHGDDQARQPCGDRAGVDHHACRHRHAEPGG